MVTGDDRGTIILWDLKNKRIAYRMESIRVGLMVCSFGVLIGSVCVGEFC